MPAFYKVDKQRHLVMSTGSGVVTFADLLAHQEKLLADPDFSPDFSQLWDLAHVTKVELTNEELRRLAARSIFSPASRRAILASSDLVFGLSRMFEIFREPWVKREFACSAILMMRLTGFLLRTTPPIDDSVLPSWTSD